MSKSKPSPVIQIMDIVWDNANKSTAHSWERLNHSMRAALTLAIGSGMPFAETDVRHILDNYNSGYWVSDSIEWIYSQAISAENKSAIASFESAVRRQPIIADNVSFRDHNEFTHGDTVNRQRERLAIGFSFLYRGISLKVTSFNDVSGIVLACSYKPKTEKEYRDKIDKRFKLTREDIIADRAERKERDALLKQLTAVGEKNGNAADIAKRLGVKSKSDYAKLPIEKIRKVAAHFCD